MIRRTQKWGIFYVLEVLNPLLHFSEYITSVQLHSPILCVNVAHFWFYFAQDKSCVYFSFAGVSYFGFKSQFSSFRETVSSDCIVRGKH